LKDILISFGHKQGNGGTFAFQNRIGGNSSPFDTSVN